MSVEGSQVLLQRFLDPVVWIAGATALITVTGSYFTLSARIDRMDRDQSGFIQRMDRQNSDLQADIIRNDNASSQLLLMEQSLAAIGKWEDEHHLEHDAEWTRQNEENSKLQTATDALRQDLAVLRAELDGIISNRKHLDEKMTSSPP